MQVVPEVSRSRRGSYWGLLNKTHNLRKFSRRNTRSLKTCNNINGAQRANMEFFPIFFQYKRLNKSCKCLYGPGRIYDIYCCKCVKAVVMNYFFYTFSTPLQQIAGLHSLTVKYPYPFIWPGFFKVLYIVINNFWRILFFLSSCRGRVIDCLAISEDSYTVETMIFNRSLNTLSTWHTVLDILAMKKLID